MTAALIAAQTAADYTGPWAGAWAGPWFLLIPLFWILVLILFFALARRFWWGRHASEMQGAGAESVLRERYARGEIDETEYRQRLEVLRADRKKP
ncbi:SHOCT domain-containing protein [Sinomonas mesophila]|uniref:SHOCT domain-containing protein n=1 Tax=Sinomonas mesophila TaxID=1531955 RepID=UPI000987894F|nr:SHOCT domain-containing protein [Sinomonas mesophila]